jgi:hypothetical protein
MKIKLLVFAAHFCLFSFALIMPLYSQEQIVPEVLRGQVRIDIEPIYASFMDIPLPMDKDTIYRRALDEASMFFSAIIYGWSFDYEIGERARNIPEIFELTPLGEILFGDPNLYATDTEVRDNKFYAWADYRMNESQLRRMKIWHSGIIKNAQAVGYGPLGGPINREEWLDIKKTTLEDAARAAVRRLLQAAERNRPKEARGYIALDSFPLFWIDAGRWAVSARFKVEVIDIVPFAAY